MSIETTMFIVRKKGKEREKVVLFLLYGQVVHQFLYSASGEHGFSAMILDLVTIVKQF